MVAVCKRKLLSFAQRITFYLLTSDGKWNSQMEITDNCISNNGILTVKKAGTSGWSDGDQLYEGRNSDVFAFRLMVFMILLLEETTNLN